MKSIAIQIAEDKEIQDMRTHIYKETGKWIGLLFWEGETLEDYRRRLKSIIADMGVKDERFEFDEIQKTGGCQIVK